MSKYKSPAYQRYPKDYLSDALVQSMTLEEEGMYNRLMDYCWLEGELINDLDFLKSLCKGVYPTAIVMRCFTITESGKLRHNRLDEERESQLINSKRRSLAGLKGNAARWGIRKRKKRIIAIGSESDRNVSQSDNPAIAEHRLSSSSSSSISLGDKTSVLSYPKGKRAPANFIVTEELIKWAREKVPSVDIEKETESFRDHQYKDAKTDWNASWRTWMRNAADFNRGSNGLKPARQESYLERIEKGGEIEPLSF
jgi:uncharacterized protein YdaU (DUF1376 family)